MRLAIQPLAFVLFPLLLVFLLLVSPSLAIVDQSPGVPGTAVDAVVDWEGHGYDGDDDDVGRMTCDAWLGAFRVLAWAGQSRLLSQAVRSWIEGELESGAEWVRCGVEVLV